MAGRSNPRPNAPPPIDPGFDMPPRLTNAEGRPRTVGVEIEFAGLSAEEAARALADRFGGSVEQHDPHAFVVEGTGFGKLSVELDSRFVHPAPDGDSLIRSVGSKIVSWVGSAASYVIPCEIVTAPIPMPDLPAVDELVACLRAAGAKGTQDGALYAFGLHFNPEVPDRQASTIAAILRAFVLLNPWLRRQVAPDATRSLLGFADPFPDAYVRRLADPAYRPDLAGLIDQYIAENPTRNRDLDCLPLFRFLDEDRVLAALPHEKIRSRPTFHYRLPDARVSDPGWSIAPDWNRWVAIEQVAADADRLDRLGEAYLSFTGESKSWADRAERVAFA
jgi:hypothetical protein